MTTTYLNIDGLTKIYATDTAAYFEFESQSKAEVAAEKVRTAGPLNILRSDLVPEGAKFVKGYSLKQMGALGSLKNAEELISFVGKIMKNSEISSEISVSKIELINLKFNI